MSELATKYSVFRPVFPGDWLCESAIGNERSVGPRVYQNTRPIAWAS